MSKLLIGILLFISYFIQKNNGNLVCPAGWSKIYERCYAVFPTRTTFTEALDHCQRYGGKLAEPAGLTVNNAVKNIVPSSITEYRIGYHRIGYTGTDDALAYWSDNMDTSVEVGTWGNFEPQVANGNCVNVNTTDGLWYMKSCDLLSSSVCELVPCPDDTFRCSNGRVCLGQKYVCNGENDCGDSSDERNCPSFCTKYMYDNSGTVQTITHPSGNVNYPASSTCLWVLEGPPGTNIQVQVLNFKSETNIDVLEFWEGEQAWYNGTCLAKISGDLTQDYNVLVSRNNFMTVRFISDQSVEMEGFTLQWRTSFHCQWTKFENRRMTITDTTQYANCNAACLNDGSCLGFMNNKIDNSCYKIMTFSQPLEDSCCDLYVKTCPGTTNLPVVSGIPNRGGIVQASRADNQIYTPFYPSLYPAGQQIAWVIETTGRNIVTLQVLDIELCGSDKILIKDGDSFLSETIATLTSGSSAGQVIMSTRNGMFILMSLHEHLSCRGALFSYREGCDFSLTENSGTFFTPGYGVENYTEVITCTWRIDSVSGRKMKINFNHFDLATGDTLQVYIGTNEQGTKFFANDGYTGYQANPQEVDVPNGQAYVVFKSYSMKRHRGFNATYISACPTFGSDLSVSNTGDVFSPSTVTVSCANNGFYLQEPYTGSSLVTLTCLPNGQYNQTIPQCDQAYCSMYPLVANSYISGGDGVRGGNSVNYTCLTGYSNIGPLSVTCNSDGSWNTPPSCTAASCPPLSSSLLGGSRRIVSGTGTSHGTILKYTCNSYYELIGISTIACENGQWSNSPPYCTRIRCPVPNVNNGFLNRVAPLYQGDSITVTCNNGYELDGQNPFLCGVDAVPKCNNINECSDTTLCKCPVGAVSCINGTCMDYAGGYSCNCPSGYTFSSGYCRDIAECSGITNMCHHTCTDSAGSYTCDCSNGYTLYSRIGLQGIVPLSGQTGLSAWNDLYINHSCIRVQCPSPLSKIASNQKALSLISSSLYYLGDRLRISCKIGYVIMGRSSPEFEIQCLGDGTWSNGLTCQVANCTRDPTFLSSVLPSASQIQYGQRYSLECTLPDNTRVSRYQVCSYNRATNTYQLKGDLMTCPVIDCGTPEFLAGGSYGFPCTTYGCNFTFGCAVNSNYRKNGTSSYGDSIVRCESNGRWDFGSLTCIGGVCDDPGAPPDGYRVNSAVTTFREGSTVTFGCNRPGYTVSSPYPLLCKVCDRTADNVLVWNNSRPVCIDTQAPSFSYCSVIDYTVTMLTAPNFTVPIPLDNSGLVQTMSISTSNSRANFHPSHVVDEDMTVSYTAVDAVGNSQTCQIAIHIRDETPPVLSCLASREYIINNENDINYIQINQTFIQVAETNAQIFTSPVTVVISKQTIGLVQRASIAAFDAAANSATCQVQILTSAPKCQPWTLEVENANRVCITTSNGGNRCAIQCNNDYRFFENVDVDRIIYECSPQGDWTRTPAISGSVYTNLDLPQCRPFSRSYYRQTNVLRYQINNLNSLQPNCSAFYLQNLGLQWATLMNNLQTLCRNNSIHSYIVTQPLNQNIDRMSVTISNSPTQSTVSVYVSFEIEIRLDSTNDDQFTGCANKIRQAFQDMPTAVMAPVNGLPLSSSNGFNCPASTQTAAVSDSSLTNGFVCGRYDGCERQQYLSSDRTTYCVRCPDNGKTGYYKASSTTWTKCANGTYRHPTDYTQCTTCPQGTRSVLTGLARQDQCYLSCPLGMRSASGLAPCTECGQNSYSADGVNCTPCPTNTLTRGTGKTSITDCLARCGLGEFSHDGHIPCTKCPRHYYQPSFGGTRCIPCNSGYITTGIGSTSLSNCTQGFNILCSVNPCQNGGTCFAIEHDFSCTCQPGYTGRRCENGLSACASNPCYNNGTCSAVVGSNGFTCSCTGSQYDPATRCALKDEAYKTISDCGNENLCNKAGSGCNFTHGTLSCVQFGQLRRNCYCRPGYTGERCQTNINECVSNPCQNGGQCVDNVNSFTCTCPLGYTGAFCEVWDEIAICRGKCGVATCTDDYQNGNFTCMCPNDQFYENNTCSQINHCASNPCHNGGTCNNRYGGYTCTCTPGNANPDCLKFVYECASNPCKNGGNCQDGQNDYTCHCPAGTQGKNCDDIPNNCSPNPCHPNNTASACQELVDDFVCPCKEGFYGKTCSEGNVNCNSFPCFHNATCVPTSDSYSCQCAQGWVGTHCGTEIDQCTSLTPCQNGATCVNIVDGYICRCASNYVGSTCSILNDPCQVANPCANSATCYVSNGLPQCNCPSGFQGAGCHIRSDSCSTTNCQNGATCVIQNLQAVCNCLPGYTGSQCQTNIDECASNPCPRNSRCIDGVNSYTCDCNDGLIGQDCSKPLSHNFDFIVASDIGCGETNSYTEDSLFNLGSDALSMSVWLRFTDKHYPGVVYSLYGLEQNLESPPVLLAQLAASTINFNLASSSTVITFSEEIDDGKWHHFVFTWNGRSSTGSSSTTGRVVFYIDGVKITERTNFGTNGQLPHFGWVLIGGEYDSSSRKIIKGNGFQGRLSRLYIMTSELNLSPDINALYRHEIVYVPAIVIPKPVADMLENGRAVIDYQSELASGKCLKSTSCVGIVDFTKYPSVTSCPDDTLTITSRGQKSVWSSGVFTGTTSVSSNRQSGAEELNWQTYGIWNVGRDADNNAAVCIFRIYNRATACSSAVKPNLPLDGSQSCVSNAGMERCQISCPNNKFPVDAGPKYYTCGIYSMYGEYERKDKFVYPACADSADLTYNVEVRGTYNLVSGTCNDALKDLLISEIRQSFTTISGKWRGDGTGLCGTSCNQANVSVTCLSNSRADVVIRFKRISNPLLATGNVNQNSPVYDAVINEVGQDSLDYTSNGQSLVRESVLVDLTPSCQDPFQVVGDYCVKCAQGYNYNNAAGICTQCVVGQYQDEVGQRSCKSCQIGYTTKTTGSQSASDCLQSCGTGRYYNSASLGCQDCEVGYYQPARGKFSCIACDPGLVTYGTGSTSKSQCIDPSSTTTTTIVTGEGSTAPSIIDTMSLAEIAAVVIGCLIVIVIVVFVVLFCLRKKLPCFEQEKIYPEGPSEWKNVNKYGETDLTFVSYKLNDLRLKRGVQPLEKQPLHPKDYIPRFMEKPQKKAKQRRPVVMANNQVTSHMNHELPPIKIKKSKRGKRKSRKHRTLRDYDDDEMNMMAPPSDTRLPKPLPPKFKPPRPSSEGSFNTSSSYLHAQNQSFNMSPNHMNSNSFKTSVGSPNHYDEISPRPSGYDNKINIDSDDDDMR